MDINDALKNLNNVEKQQVLKILQEANIKGKSEEYQKLMNDIWDELPVDVDTFIDNDKYMRNYFYPDGKACIVYPRWRQEMKKVFEDPYKYSEITVTGGIGLGKSEFAKMCLCYLLYRLMCLKNPQLFYNKPVSKPIVFLLFNNNLTLAENVLLKPFVEMLSSSPWFMERGQITGREHIRYKAKKNIDILPGSRSSHAIGMDVFAGLMDEVNFAPGQDVSLEKNKIMETYMQINGRITSRFRVEGNIHGKLFVVSSKKSEYDFIEQYAQRMKDQPNFYMIDDKIWNIVPPEKTGYSGKMFNLAIGGDILPSKVIGDDEDINDYVKQGYQIMEVPIEEKQKFILNMEQSLMDVAAVSVSYVTKFLNYEIISQCYSEDKNPFSQEIISTGIKDAMEISDFFLLNEIPKEIRKKPTFIHIDTSLTGDRTGIGAVCMLGKERTDKFDMKANKTIKTYQTIYKHVFNVEIQCPKNSEISFQKTRNFISYLRQNGFNICGITTDGFQSADTRQMLQLAGFENVDRLNFERTPEIYMNFRNALIEKRIKLLRLENLERELLLVERNNQSGKITHPENTGDGHGDGADGCVGALYNAILHEEEYSNVLTTLEMLSPGDGDIDRNEILKIAAGVQNMMYESQRQNIQKQNSEIPIKTNSKMSDWIL